MCFCTLDDVHMSTLLYSKTFISPAKSIWFTKTGRQNLGYIKSVLDHQGRGHLEATLYQRTVTHEDHWDCQTLNMLSKYNFPRYHYCLSYIYAEVLLISPIRELYRNRYYLATKLTFNNNYCVKKQQLVKQIALPTSDWLNYRKLIWYGAHPCPSTPTWGSHGIGVCLLCQNRTAPRFTHTYLLWARMGIFVGTPYKELLQRRWKCFITSSEIWAWNKTTDSKLNWILLIHCKRSQNVQGHIPFSQYD